jgi:hypothetical protein
MRFVFKANFRSNTVRRVAVPRLLFDAEGERIVTGTHFDSEIDAWHVLIEEALFCKRIFWPYANVAFYKAIGSARRAELSAKQLAPFQLQSKPLMRSGKRVRTSRVGIGSRPEWAERRQRAKRIPEFQLEVFVQPEQVQVHGEAACIECGCTDSCACSNACWWLAVDRQSGTGVCSNCSGALRRWNNK